MGGPTRRFPQHHEVQTCLWSLLGDAPPTPQSADHPLTRLLGDADNTTGQPGSRVARCLAQLVPAFAKVVRISMNHNRSPNNTVLPSQGNDRVRDVHFGNTIITSSDVAQVTDVPVGIRWCTVFLAMGVEMGTGTHASVSVITELVDVKSVESFAEASYFTDDLNRLSRGLLREVDCSRSLLGTFQYTDGLDRHHDNLTQSSPVTNKRE